MPWLQYTYVIHMYAKNAMNFRFENFAQQSESIDHTHCFHCKVNSQIKGKIWFQFSDCIVKNGSSKSNNGSQKHFWHQTSFWEPWQVESKFAPDFAIDFIGLLSEQVLLLICQNLRGSGRAIAPNPLPLSPRSAGPCTYREGVDFQ